MSKQTFFITDEDIRGACYWRGIRETLERIDKKLAPQLRPKHKIKSPNK